MSGKDLPSRRQASRVVVRQKPQIYHQIKAINGIRSCVQLPDLRLKAPIALSHMRLDFGLGAVARIW